MEIVTKLSQIRYSYLTSGLYNVVHSMPDSDLLLPFTVVFQYIYFIKIPEVLCRIRLIPQTNFQVSIH